MSSRKFTEQEEEELARRQMEAMADLANSKDPVVVPSFVANRTAGASAYAPASKPTVAKAGKSSALAATKKKAAPKKKKTAAAADPKSSWPRVKEGDWGYVYICAGPFKGRFGYYDDEDDGALVYFGAPLVGDGPYTIPLSFLRNPPAKYHREAAFAPC